MLSLIVAIIAGAVGLGLHFISRLAAPARLTPLPLRVLPRQPLHLRHPSCRIPGDLP